MRWQKSNLILTALFQFTKVHAPSQSGKTTFAEVLAAAFAYAFPMCHIGILSTIAEQSERLRANIRDKFINCHKVEAARQVDVDKEGSLVLAYNRSKITATPHSIKAVTGNPFDLLILDEMEKYTVDPAKIYAECVARLGKTGGKLVIISSVDMEGKEDREAPEGYSGSFFYYNWNQTFKKRSDPNKSAIAVGYTYHVSPYLVENYSVLRAEMVATSGEEAANAHYLGIPRKAIGKPIFAKFYSRKDHFVADSEVLARLNPNYPLACCIDPGLNKAAVLLQLDLDFPRLSYLRVWRGDRSQLFKDFVRLVYAGVRKEFPHFDCQWFADVAAKKMDQQTLAQDAEIINEVVHQWPTMEWQTIAPGIQIMKSFMKMRDGFYVSDRASFLDEAFSSGLVHKVENGKLIEAWAKDGVYEHVADAARYPLGQLLGGGTLDQAGQQEVWEVVQNSYCDPVTGY